MANYSIYPPIVSTYMPAFVLGENAKIYFSLSAYMTIGQIKTDMIQVVINNQSTNSSVLTNNRDYLFAELKQDNQNRYYVEINKDDFNIEINRFYKAQLRFVSADSSATLENFNVQTYKNDLSEWSTVCLIKAISTPDLNIQRFVGVDSYKTAIVTTTSLKISGNLTFKDSSEEETLYSYRILLYEEKLASVASDTSELILDSEIIYTDTYNPNQLNYTLNYNLVNTYKYLLRIIYTTESGYEGQKDYLFSVSQTILDPIENAELQAENNPSEGKITVSLTQEDESSFEGVLVLRRTSSESNFTFWEDIQYFIYSEPTQLKLIYEDVLVKHGVFYKYQVLKQDEYENRGTPLELPENNPQVLCYFEDIFLTGTDTEQLNIKFDPNISSFKYTVVESKTDTLGSKYPFIRRNGNTYYREFPIAGLITHFCDSENPQEDSFLNLSGTSNTYENYNPTINTLDDKRQKYIGKDNNILTKLYQTEYYDKNQNINGYNDYLLEREYREEILNFLYDNKVRLFRSPTEGNILIKLMNISLTPNISLGRRIYSFSATAYEIDEYNFENCVNYNIHILNENDLKDSKVSYYTQIGQQRVSIDYNYNENKIDTEYIDISDLIEKKYNSQSTSNYTVDVLNYNWIRFDFMDSENRDAAAPQLIDTQTFKILKEPNENCIAGFLLRIDGENIIVSESGFYELCDSDTEIHKVEIGYCRSSFIKPTVYIDYLANMKLTPREISLTTIYRRYIIGQIHGQDLENQDIITLIKEKYSNSISDTSITGSPVAVTYLSFEGLPGLKINIKDAADGELHSHYLNQTGILTLYDPNTYFQSVTIEAGNTTEVNPLQDIIIDYYLLVEEGIYQ